MEFEKKKKNVVILGAGLAGLSAAWKLSKLTDRNIIVLEKDAHVGGLASTVNFDGWRMDLGSHRIHPQYFPEILTLIRELIGQDLITKPRKGRLILKGKLVEYPPSFGELLKAVGPYDFLRCAFSFIGRRKNFLKSETNGAHRDYESFLLSKAGKGAYDLFYAPYARKVYGINPDKLSSQAAKQRITSRKPQAAAINIAAGTLLGKANYYHYPPEGFGSIADSLYREATSGGVQVIREALVKEVLTSGRAVSEIVYESAGAIKRIPVETVISTMPINNLVNIIQPGATADVAKAAGALSWRGVRLLQVVVGREKCLEGETYYLPEERYLFGRISEPIQFSRRLSGKKGATSLNIEVIATPGDALWNMSDKKFAERVFDDMEILGICRREEVIKSRSIKLPNVYPVYDLNYKKNLSTILEWTRFIKQLYSIGRGGMFFHGNADHSIHLGLRAAESVASGKWSSFGCEGEKPDESFLVRD